MKGVFFNHASEEIRLAEPAFLNVQQRYSIIKGRLFKNKIFGKNETVPQNSLWKIMMIVLIMTIFTNGIGQAQDSGLITYKEFEKWGFKNQRGEVVIPAIYDLAYPVRYNGLSKVQKQMKWGFIDHTGKEIIPCEYDDATISNGLIGVKKNNQWGVLDQNNKEFLLNMIRLIFSGVSIMP